MSNKTGQWMDTLAHVVEQMLRPNVKDSDVVVTPEMREAGLVAFMACYDLDGGLAQVEAAYRAMHALAPVELIAQTETSLMRERDHALAKLRATERDLEKLRAAFIRMIDKQGVVFANALPAPEPNPFRDFGHDPRRMGPIVP